VIFAWQDRAANPFFFAASTLTATSWFGAFSGSFPWKLPSPLSHTRYRVGLVSKRVGEPACARLIETAARQQRADSDNRARDFIGRIAFAKAEAEYTSGFRTRIRFPVARLCSSSAEMQFRGDEIPLIRDNVIAVVPTLRFAQDGAPSLEAQCN
jgi:hypothetical protein